MHPTHKFVLFGHVSHHSQDMQETHAWLKITQNFGASCSNRIVLLNLSSCSSYAVSDPRSPLRKSLTMSRQMRPHVDPTCARHFWVPHVHLLHLVLLELFCCLSLAEMSLFRAMPSLHNPDSPQCDRELRCLQTTCRIFSVQPSESFQLQFLTMGDPLLLCQV